jgi:hypothetical protein
VVALVGGATGIGFFGQMDVAVLVGGTLAALIAWFLWAVVVYNIGTKVLREPQTLTDLGELLRTIGFAWSPGLLLVLGIIPIFGGLIFLTVWIWMQVATVVAVRQALIFTSTLRAAGVVLLAHAFFYVTVTVVFG